MEHEVDCDCSDDLPEKELKRLIELFYRKLDRKLVILFEKYAEDINAKDATVLVVNTLSIILEQHGLLLSSNYDTKDIDIKDFVTFTRDTMEILSSRFLDKIKAIKKQREHH